MISNMLRFPLSMLENDMENLFNPNIFRAAERRTRLAYPAINIGTTDKNIDVFLFLPGMKPEDIELVIEKNMLSVSGIRKLPLEVNENQDSYRQERFEGEFKRVITLPETVDTETAKAVYKDGILQISIAKRAETRARKIKVSAQ